MKNKADYIIILNNDTKVSENFINKLLLIFKNNKKAGIVSPKIYFYPGFEFHKKRYKSKDLGKVIWYAGGHLDWKNIYASHIGVDEIDRGQYDFVKKTDFATGCCMMIKKNVFKKIGFLDNKYFLYWEDIDFCKRAKNKGFDIFFAPQSIIWHKNASSTSGAGGKLSVYYQTRNRALFALRYAPLKTKAAVFKNMLKMLGAKDYWIKKAVHDFFLLKFGKLTYNKDSD